jgi:general secretion pathway protein I
MSQTLQRAQPATGMTLIEVLVALAILATALAAGLRAASALTLSGERQQQTLLAQLCAENELVKLRLSRVYPGAGDQSFTCKQADRTFEGTLSIAPTPNPNFRRVDAKVFDARVFSPGERADRNEIYRISTILARY